MFGVDWKIFFSEGSDVYLECKVHSRPVSSDVFWMKDVSWNVDQTCLYEGDKVNICQDKLTENQIMSNLWLVTSAQF